MMFVSSNNKSKEKKESMDNNSVEDDGEQSDEPDYDEGQDHLGVEQETIATANQMIFH
jgi:hypothetical protein